MLDSLQFERRGIPAAALITEEFIPGAKATVVAQGVLDYSFVVVPHPLGSLGVEELEQRAELAIPQFERILTKRP